jgi:hypothetical protein
LAAISLPTASAPLTASETKGCYFFINLLFFLAFLTLLSISSTTYAFSSTNYLTKTGSSYLG